jgi:hypothetical protein
MDEYNYMEVIKLLGAKLRDQRLVIEAQQREIDELRTQLSNRELGVKTSDE